jgi:hypothetical protein
MTKYNVSRVNLIFPSLYFWKQFHSPVSSYIYSYLKPELENSVILYFE